MARQATIWFRAATQTFCTTLAGRRYTLGRTEEEAEQEFYRLRLRLSLGQDGKAVEQPDATLAALVAGYLEYQHERITAPAFDVTRRFLTGLVAKFGRSERASRLDADDVRDWINSHRSWNSTTRAMCAARIKSAFRWARRKRILADNPLEGLSMPAGLSRESALTPEQYAVVLERTDGPFRDVCVMMWETGVRPSELCRLSVEHYHHASQSAELPGKTSGKTGRPRRIYLSPRAVQLIEANLEGVRAGRIFRNHFGKAWTMGALAKRFRELRLPFPCTPTSFRRGFITDLAVKGTPIPVISELASHMGPQMIFRHYLKMRNRPAEVMQALQAARPLPGKRRR